MAVTDAYADAATYRAVVGKVDSGSDSEILKDLKAVSRFLDHKLGRFFTKDASTVERVFVVPRASFGPLPYNWAESENPFKFGNYARVLQVDDMAAAPSSIIIDEDDDGDFDDETALSSSDYELLPRNAALGPEPSPYTAIEIPSWSSRGGWPAGRRVRITAVWGWPSVPEAIARATCHLTGILRLESPRATSRVTEVGEVVSTSREAQGIVQDLIRHYKSARSLV